MQAFRFTLGALALATLAACGKQATETAAGDASSAAADNVRVVKIGSANPLTGPFAHWGRDSDNGVVLAIEEANTEGVTLGGQKVKFEVVSEDDQADPKVATQVAQRFVDAGVAASVTSPKFTQQGYANTFRIIANDTQQGNALAAHAVGALGAKKIAVIDDRSTYGQGLADDFARAVEAAGCKVVKREYTTNSASDFMAILTSIKGSQPDLVFYGGMDAQAGPMVKQMKKVGLAVPYMGADGVNTAEFVKLGGEAANGSYASSAGASKEKMPGYAAFSERFKKRFGGDIQAYAPYTYDATRVLIDAMKRADSAEPAKYLAELPKTKLDGVTGPIAFDAKGDIVGGTVTLYRLENGAWKTVEAPAAQAASAAK